MAENKFFASLTFIALMFLLHACHDSEGGREKPVFQQIPAIAEIKPQKPVRIKLKRNTDGEYSWEVTGDDADRVTGADKKIRESLEDDTAAHQITNHK
ncbi:MAG: hypothetical protein OEM19_07190 [Deltaproteobacteria bacterium]|nr:hypothetical protein [Deltaproteobacteria bacterium]